MKERLGCGGGAPAPEDVEAVRSAVVSLVARVAEGDGAAPRGLRGKGREDWKSLAAWTEPGPETGWGGHGSSVGPGLG